MDLSDPAVRAYVHEPGENAHRLLARAAAAAGGSRDVGFDAYARLHRALARALGSAEDPASARRDWEEDAAGGESLDAARLEALVASLVDRAARAYAASPRIVAAELARCLVPYDRWTGRWALRDPAAVPVGAVRARLALRGAAPR